MIIIRKKRGVLRLRRNLFLKKVSGSSSSCGHRDHFSCDVLVLPEKREKSHASGVGAPFLQKKGR